MWARMYCSVKFLPPTTNVRSWAEAWNGTAKTRPITAVRRISLIFISKRRVRANTGIASLREMD